MQILKLRPHHLICSLCFQGKGYNEKFTQNFRSIYQKIHQANPKIKVVMETDDICRTCPNKLNNICRHESKVSKIDHTYLKLLRLKTGQTLSWDFIKINIKKFLTMNDFQKTCKECSWYKLDLCEPIISNFIK